jgi:catechol 2,3-dioxygenase-like lactoylglutathione lyase family enzyme
VVQISFVSIPVTDQDRAKRFYCDALGFTCGADQEFAPGRRWIDLELPGGGAGITLVTWLEGMPPGSVQGLVLAVDDIDATFAELDARGLRFDGGIDDTPYGRFASFADPDGNGWVLRGPITSSSATSS